VLSGEITLVTDAGEELLRSDDAAGFKAGDRNCEFRSIVITDSV
jgi:uncharacterized cupin superfamily protein